MIKKITKIINKRQVRSFTLIETLVSVLIVTIVISGPIAVAISSLGYARLSKDQLESMYLAEEATELLHNEQDSIFLRCMNKDYSNCVMSGNDRSPRDAAWRIFKERLQGLPTGVGPSCFDSDNSFCAFDMVSMGENNKDNPPTKYSTDPLVNGNCSYLYFDGSNNGDKTNGLYLCQTNAGVNFTRSKYKRYVQMKSSASGNSYDDLYNNDLRAVVTVSYQSYTGYIKSFKLVDYFHAGS